jgi:hypothetical protein
MPSSGTMVTRPRIGSVVDELLTLHGTMHRKKLLEHLIDKGIMGSELRPLAYLAAYLSDNREKYAPDGHGNFSLIRPAHNEPPPASPNGAGSAGVGDTSATGAHP